MAELAGVYAMFVVVRAKSNVSDFEAPENLGLPPCIDTKSSRDEWLIPRL